ncbi:MAG TPA: ATP-binding cassette domain-containing protein [Clostridia bacterium]
MAEIIVEHLTKDYGHGRGVFDVSFEVNKGEVFGFLGPNGAGKSTTIRHLMGFSKPDSGRTKIFNKDTFENYTKFMDKVGYLPGEIALPAGLKGYEFIDMMKKMKKCKDDEWIKHLINLFDLDPSGETKRMSLGDKRKLAVVVAFMNDPEVLILDEPTSGLDLKMQQRFVEYIKKEKERGKTILLSSHIFSEVDATCDKIAIIKDGRIVSQFIADDLRHKQDKVYKILFCDLKSKDDFVNQTNNSNITLLENNQNDVLISINDKDINKLISLLSNYEISDFEHVKETLEDYFMSYYKEEKDFGGAL